MNVYGASKAAAERPVLEAHAEALVVRNERILRAVGPAQLRLVQALESLLEAEREFVAIEDDLIVSPTYVPDLVTPASIYLVFGRRARPLASRQSRR